MRNFLRELRRRNVYKVAAAYLLVAFIVLQLAELGAGAFELPDWFEPMVWVLCGLGFPIALVLAWAFDLTPEGVRRTPPVEGPGEEGSAAGTAGPGRMAFQAAIGLGFVTLVIAGMWYALRSGLDVDVQVAPQAEGQAVAVLPFDALSRDEQSMTYARGIHDDLLNKLYEVSGLTVISRTAVEQYRDSELTIAQIADELDVQWVMEGGVEKLGDRIRVSVQLIDPETEAPAWADSYRRELTAENLFELQSDITLRIARSLRAELTEQEQARIAASPTETLAAYDLYLEGREASKRYDEEGRARAIGLYREALEVDPDYALAWAGLGNAFARRANASDHLGRWSDSAVAAGRRAVELDPDLAQGYKALGDALLVRGRVDEALVQYETALGLNPNYYEAWNNAAIVHYGRGRFDEALWAFRRSARLAPNQAFPRVNVAYAYKFLGLDEEARRWVDRARELDPDLVHVRLIPANLAVYEGRPDRAVAISEDFAEELGTSEAWAAAGAMAYMADDFERAVRWVRRSLSLVPGNEYNFLHRTEVLLGLSLVASGREDAGAEVLRREVAEYEHRVEEAGEEAWPPPWDLATAHAALGHDEEALEWLERAYANGFRWIRWLPYEAAFDELRDSPRFRTVQGRMETDVEAMRRRVVEEEPSWAPPSTL